jgi:hypothetical protein
MKWVGSVAGGARGWRGAWLAGRVGGGARGCIDLSKTRTIFVPVFVFIDSHTS